MFAQWKGNPVTIEKNTAVPFPLEEGIRDSLYYASLAPSSHNSQPWRIIYHQEKRMLELLPDETRFLSAADPKGREAYLSLGAFLENFKQALAAHGYQPSIAFGQEGSAVQIRLADSKTIPKNPEQLALMEKRHTEKRSFSPGPLPSETIAALLDNYPSVTYYPKGTTEYTYLCNGAAEAMAVQSANQEKRNELAEWLRFSDQEALEKKDGLPAEQLGMSGLQKTFYYLFMNRETAKGDAYAKQGASMTKKQAESCAGFFVITEANVSYPAGTAESLLETGMVLEAFWLETAKEEVAIHPLSQMLEEAPYCSEITNKLGLSAPVQMVLRAGKVKGYGENYKIRRDLSTFVQEVSTSRQ